ncbi:MAG: type III-A CRISPR-associated protein Cas10/Csm1 [Chloroflexota bacterium]
MFEDATYRAVVLGALLHDVGKLYQRGSYGSLELEGQHPKLAADFVSAFRDLLGAWADPNLLETLVKRHHQNARAFPSELLVQHTPDPDHRALAYLISEADHLSASERGLHERGQFRDFRTVPLVSIYRSLEVKGNASSGVANHHAGTMTDTSSLGKAFPADLLAYPPGELTQLIRDFGEEFNKRLKPELTGDFRSLLAHLLNILYRYTWRIPSDTQEDNPDISLYDHLRTTCAISACLYQRHLGKSGLVLENAIHTEPQEPEFLLAAGDVSGIQGYIFGISRIGEGGVARRLRARSLMVQLFTDVAARTILERLDLPQACQVMAAGGNFYLLLPNTEKALAILRQVSRELDDWFLQQLHGEMALNLEWVKVCRDEFGGGSDAKPGFGDVLRHANDELQRRKRRRFQGALSSGDGWDEDSFLLNVHYQGEGVCGACGKFPRIDRGQEGQPEEEHLCQWCLTDRETGTKLPRASLLRLGRDSGLDIKLSGGWSADIGPWRPDLREGDIAVALNRFDLADYGRREAHARFMANHVPTAEDGRRLLTFEKIAALSQGRQMLGFLKMDVDNLGELMVFGLKRSRGQHLDTISRIMTLSRSLDAFFCGWVNHLLETDFPLCYAIFSGGDDLFVAGPWDQVLELAAKVREDFRRWVARDDITISAGVVLTHPSYPISRSAEEAEEALERSKHRDGKDSITLLGHTLTWKEWTAIHTRWKELEKWINQANTSTAFVYSLLEYGRMWRRYYRWRQDPKSDPGGVLGLRFQPLLAYNLGRNLDRAKAPALYAWAEPFTRPQPFSPAQQLELDNLDLLAELLIYGKGRDQ